MSDISKLSNEDILKQLNEAEVTRNLISKRKRTQKPELTEAITKAQVKEKVMGMVKDLPSFFSKKVDKILSSGAVDLESYDDNFMLPKIIMVAIASELADQYRLSGNRKFSSEVKNLISFL